MADRAMTVLVHGRSKAGKTTLAASAHPPIVFADVESAARFLQNHRQVRWDPFTEPPPVYDGTWDMAVVQTRDMMTIERIYQWLVSGQHPFKSFVLDSISELQQRYIDGEVGRVQPKLQDWGDVFRKMRGLLADIRDLMEVPGQPLETVVVTAMTKHVDGMWRPWVQGQLGTTMPYLFDVIGFLSVQQHPQLDGTVLETRVLQTREGNGVEAGERVQGRIPEMLANPTIWQMMDMVFPPEAPVAAPAPAPAADA